VPDPDVIVAVTEPEFRRAEATFTNAKGISCRVAPADEAPLAAAIAAMGARHAIVGHWPYREALYHALPRGSVLARFGVGHDGIDKVKATAAGLLCTNTPGVLDQSVAELTMAFISAAARHVTTTDGEMRGGAWKQRQGVELAGKTLAIIGAGRIGTAVARIASAGFGMRVVGCRVSALAGVPAEPPYAEITNDFRRAVESASFVSLHMPTTPANLKYVNRERLAMLRPDAWVINTARGAVVDEAGLYDALAGGRLGGAALDVFDVEPYQPVDPSRDLRTLPNVILAPHVGSHTVESNRRMAQRAIQNVLFGHAGRFEEMDLLNPQVLGSS